MDDYWEQRYKSGNNSGKGSYDKFAEFKAQVINDLIVRYDIKSIIDFGCGDGNQAAYISCASYLGFDISPSAIERCRQRDRTKQFDLLSNYKGESAEASLSLDVIYHLVNDDDYNHHMHLLFDSASRFVIIYSSNRRAESKVDFIKHRIFTIWPDYYSWMLVKIVPSPFEKNVSGFYIYTKI